MLYSGLTNIRDCIAFPKTAKGTDLMTGTREPSMGDNSRNCISRVIEFPPFRGCLSPKRALR